MSVIVDALAGAYVASKFTPSPVDDLAILAILAGAYLGYKGHELYDQVNAEAEVQPREIELVVPVSRVQDIPVVQAADFSTVDSRITIIDEPVFDQVRIDQRGSTISKSELARVDIPMESNFAQTNLVANVQSGGDMQVNSTPQCMPNLCNAAGGSIDAAALKVALLTVFKDIIETLHLDVKILEEGEE